MFLIGCAVVVFGMVFAIILLDGSAYNLIDVPSLVILLCAVLGVLTATKSFQVFYAGLRAAVLPQEEITSEMRGRAATLFRLLSKTVAIVAVIAVLACARNLLYLWDFSTLGGAANVGVNLYSSLMAPFYAMLFTTALFEPVVFVLKKRAAAPTSHRASAKGQASMPEIKP